MVDFDVRALLSNKSEQKVTVAASYIANYTRPLFEATSVFTAEVIQYQKQWKRVTNQNCDLFVVC